MKTNFRPSILIRICLILVLLLTAVSFGSWSTAKAEPKDDVLRLAGSTYFDSLDPAFAKDLSTAFMVRQVFRGLVVLGDNLQPAPSIADSWTISEDGLSYSFHIRDDAAFQDGRPIESGDVKASFERALDPDSAGGDVTLLGGPTFLSDITGSDEVMANETDDLTGVEIVDDQSLVIHLEAPRSTFLIKLASPPASIVDTTETSDDDWWLTPNGSGPFEVTDLDPADHLNLSRFADFAPEPAKLKKVVFRLGAAALQALNLYEADEIDVGPVNVYDLDRVTSPESDLNDQLQSSPLFEVEYIAFNRNVAPMNDPKIRQAIWQAFPRDNVARIGYGGWVSAANGLIPDGLLGVEQWQVDTLPFDLEAAKQALAESSYGNAASVPPIDIYVSAGASAVALRDVIQQNLGITINVINVEWNSFADGLANKEFPAYEMDWYVDYPDPESLLLLLFGEDRPDNYIQYSDSEFNRLLDQAANEQDLGERIDLYTRAQQLLMDDLVVFPMVYGQAYIVVKPWVSGYEVTPMGPLYLDNVEVDT